MRRLAAIGTAAVALAASRAAAQGPCASVSAASPEGQLLAWYTAPLAFSALEQPARLSEGVVQVVLETTQVPRATDAQRTISCRPSAGPVASNLSEAFVRPRIIVGLPAGFAAEVAWIPMVDMGNARPNLVSGALSYTMRAGSFAGNALRLQGRVHATRGWVEGAVTCPPSALRPDAGAACYGFVPSRDRYHPETDGGELLLAVDVPGYGFYVGGGANTFAPVLTSNFLDGAGVRDTTRVAGPRQWQYPLLFGGSLRFTDAIALLGQFTVVPNRTSFLRVGASVRVR